MDRTGVELEYIVCMMKLSTRSIALIVGSSGILLKDKPVALILSSSWSYTGSQSWDNKPGYIYTVYWDGFVEKLVHGDWLCGLTSSL